MYRLVLFRLTVTVIEKTKKLKNMINLTVTITVTEKLNKLKMKNRTR